MKQLTGNAIDSLFNWCVASAHEQQRSSEMLLRLGQLPGLPGGREQGQHPSGRREDEKGTLPEEGFGECRSPLSLSLLFVFFCFSLQNSSNGGLAEGMMLSS